MMLTERQQTAEALAREIHRMGGFVLNPMPLDSDARLRFEVLDSHRDGILKTLSSWNWGLTLRSASLRFNTRDYAAKPSSIYEIDLPRERAPVPDDRRIISGEIARKEKSQAEVLAVQKYLGLLP